MMKIKLTQVHVGEYELRHAPDPTNFPERPFGLFDCQSYKKGEWGEMSDEPVARYASIEEALRGLTEGVIVAWNIEEATVEVLEA